MKHLSFLFLLLSLLCGQSALAQSNPTESEEAADAERADSSDREEGELPGRPVPFAQHEEALKNSERWKTLSPEEKKEALDKIEHYRKLFRERQAELQEKYKPLLEKKPTKRKSLLRRNRDLSEQEFEDVWNKWQSLTFNRQKELVQKWKIPDTSPRKRRRALQKVWKRLLPTTREQFLRDLR